MIWLSALRKLPVRGRNGGFGIINAGASLVFRV